MFVGYVLFLGIEGVEVKCVFVFVDGGELWNVVELSEE